MSFVANKISPVARSPAQETGLGLPEIVHMPMAMEKIHLSSVHYYKIHLGLITRHKTEKASETAKKKSSEKPLRV